MSDTLLAAYIGLAASFGLSMVALFQKQMRAGMFGPKLEICFDPQSQIDSHVTVATSPTSPALQQLQFWLRLRVANSGRSAAKHVDVMVRDLEMLKPVSGTFEIVKTFVPLNLKWSNVGRPTLPRIPAGIEKHCDLLFIADPTTVIGGRPHGTQNIQAILQIEVHPNLNPGVLAPGTYRLTLIATASNAEPARSVIEFSVPTTWTGNSTMTGLVNLRGLPAQSSILIGG